MTRAPSDLAISRDPSVLPLSAMMISPWKLCRARYASALAMQAERVAASFRQGIKMESAMVCCRPVIDTIDRCTQARLLSKHRPLDALEQGLSYPPNITSKMPRSFLFPTSTVVLHDCQNSDNGHPLQIQPQRH